MLYDFPAMPITGGPYISAAFFCERVLREQDGVLSFIRVVDRWNLVGPTANMMPQVIQANLVVLFKAGIFRGQIQLTITPISPGNQPMQAITFPVMFEDTDERGSGVALPLGFPVQESGTYWFKVETSTPDAPQSQVATAIPMRISYLQIAGPMVNPTNPHQG